MRVHTYSTHADTRPTHVYCMRVRHAHAFALPHHRLHSAALHRRRGYLCCAAACLDGVVLVLRLIRVLVRVRVPLLHSLLVASTLQLALEVSASWTQRALRGRPRACAGRTACCAGAARSRRVALRPRREFTKACMACGACVRKLRMAGKWTSLMYILHVHVHVSQVNVRLCKNLI